MFVFWLLVILSLAGITGVVSFSKVPPGLALVARVLFALFVIVLIVFLIIGAMTDFATPDFLTF